MTVRREMAVRCARSETREKSLPVRGTQTGARSETDDGSRSEVQSPGTQNSKLRTSAAPASPVPLESGIGALDRVQAVFHRGVARVDELVWDGEQFLDVVEVRDGSPLCGLSIERRQQVF